MDLEVTNESIRVAVHVRPLVESEILSQSKECVSVDENQVRFIVTRLGLGPLHLAWTSSPPPPPPLFAQVKTSNGTFFTFDGVFGSCRGRPTDSLYPTFVSPLVAGLFAGYNATVLAYGQTGSGKTYTMGSSSYATQQQAIIPRVVHDIFTRMTQLEATHACTLRVSCVELFKEEIRDLLSTDHSDRPSIVIREVPGSGVSLVGAIEVEVSSVECMARCLTQAGQNRATSATGMNRHSSRSHAIFTLTLEQRRIRLVDSPGSSSCDVEGDRAVTPDDEMDFLAAKLHLVDLAGSERAKRTKAEGARLQEGIHINRGLLALGNVISALGDEEKRRLGAHVPYRDSKLTRVLQDSLGGNSRTLFIACISPADVNLEETLNTLKYANRARNIKNKPSKNCDPVVAEVSHLRQQLATARADLKAARAELVAFHQGGLDEGDERMAALEARALKAEEAVSTYKRELELVTAAMVAAQSERDSYRVRYENVCRSHPSLPHASNTPLDDDPAQEALLRDYLGRIATLETENRSLRCTQAVTQVFTKTKRLSMGLARGTPPVHNNRMLASLPEQQRDASNASLPSTTSPVTSDVEQEEDDLLDRDLLADLDHLTHVPTSGVGSSAEEQAFLLEQRRLGEQVEELNRQLEMRQEQMRRVGEVSALRAAYDSKLAALEEERRAAMEERNRLLGMLAKGGQNESYRERIAELEDKLKQLQRKSKQMRELETLQLRTEQARVKLESEMMSIKQQKVSLQRQMDAATKSFLDAKREQDRQLLQLRRNGQRDKLAMEKLQSLQDKQRAVLRRKTEEAEAARKRLKELLNRQQLAARPSPTLKPNEASLDCQPNPFAPLLRDDKQRREWLESELCGVLRWQDLQAVSEGDVAERNELVRRLQHVQRQVMNLERRQVATTLRASQQEQLGLLKQEERGITERIAQLAESIAKTQNELVALKSGETSSSGSSDVRRWSGLKTVPEARSMLKMLFQLATKDRERVREAESTVNDLRDELEFYREEHKLAEASLKEQIAQLTAEKAAAEAAAAAALSEARAMAHDAAVMAGGGMPSSVMKSPGLESDMVTPARGAMAMAMTPRSALGSAGRKEALEAEAAEQEQLIDALVRDARTLLTDETSPVNHENDEAMDIDVTMQDMTMMEEDESESDDDDDDYYEEEEEDEDWDPNHETPARGGGRKRPPIVAPRVAATASEEEDEIMEAIRAERALQETPIHKLTVKVLKDFLHGKEIDGRMWRAGKKDRTALLDDCRALLGLSSPQRRPLEAINM